MPFVFLRSIPSIQSTLIILCLAMGLSACGGGGQDEAETVAPAKLLRFSGVIQIPQSTQVDSDVNDPHSTHISNDSLQTAQALPNPVTLGGYVNIAGHGPSGRSQAQGDVSDYFRVEATQGQALTLTVGQPNEGNIELVLYNADHELIDQSVGEAQTKTVIAPTAGTYFVQAYAQRGASTYLLTQDANNAQARYDELRASSEFVPGQIIVRWKTGARARAGSEALSKATTSMRKHALSALSQPPEGDVLLQLDTASRPPPTATGANNPRRALLQATDPTLKAKLATLEAIQQLRADPQVEYAEPNYLRSAQFIPNDPLYQKQWHYSMINMPQAWDITMGTPAVTVAVLDTGALLSHPDLQGQWVDGYDFVSPIESAMDGDSIDPDPSDSSGNFHGTHVAGTIAALSNNGLGVAGVAPGVRVMPVRVLGGLGGTSYDLQQGVLYAAGLSNSSGTRPARRADIINLSLAGQSPSQSEQNALALARAQGVIVVAAAGNEGTDQPRYPAAYSGVISVSAVSINTTLASYSNFGNTIDIAAPGGDRSTSTHPSQSIASTFASRDPNNNNFTAAYAGSIGTSMAAPHVAGVLALMKSVRPKLTPAEVDAFLATGRLTTDLGPPGLDDSFGHGLIDAHKALKAALDTTPTPGVLIATPAAITVAPTANKLSLVLANGGTQTLAPPTVEVSASWLIVSPPQSSDGLGYYGVRIHRDGLPPGTYKAHIRFVSEGQSTTVSVVMDIKPSGAKRDSTLGSQFVFLTDSLTQQTVRVQAQRALNGTYRYEFEQLAPGNYWLFSGNDLNNDGAVCGLGESCGAYVNLTQPQALIIDSDLVAQDFESRFTRGDSALPAMITAANRHFASAPLRPQNP